MQGRRRRSLQQILVVFSFLFVFVVNAGWFDGTLVKVLNEENIAEFVSSEDGVVVFYYTPGDKDCKSIKRNLIEAAESLDFQADSRRLPKGHQLGFGAVDCSQEVKVCINYEITEFPAIRYYRDGKEKFEYHYRNRPENYFEFLMDPGLPPKHKGPGIWGEKLSDVLHLTKGNFTKFIQNYDNVLVMFYTQWCSHCKELKPHYMEASTQVRGSQLGYLTAIDCGNNQEICSQYDVKSYPTLKYFQKGIFKFDYDHGRKKSDIVSFMQNPSPPPISPPLEPKWKHVLNDVMHLSDQNFEKYIQENPSTFVMFYAPWCGHCKAMKPAYEEAATEVKKEKYGVMAAIDCEENKEVAARYGIQGYPTLKYFKNGKGIDYNGARTKEALVEFMRSPPVLPKEEL